MHLTSLGTPDLTRGELLAILSDGLREIASNYRTYGTTVVHAVGVDAWVGQVFAPYVHSLSPTLVAKDKAAVAALAQKILRHDAFAEKINARGTLYLDLRDHDEFRSQDLPDVRHFYGHQRTVLTAAEDQGPLVRLRAWAVTPQRASTHLSPLVLRTSVDQLSGALAARMLEPSPALVKRCVRAGALREALAVIAKLYELDGVVLWQFDDTKRRFLSVAAFNIGAAQQLRIPVGRVDDSPRRGIVSQINADRRTVIYDAKDRSVWQPRASGDWGPFDQRLFSGRHWRSCLAFPIIYSGRLVGALSVYSVHAAAHLLQSKGALTEHAAECGTAVAVEHDQTTIPDLARRYDEELLTANVSLNALSLIHDVSHYYWTVIDALEQTDGYLATGQVGEARRRVETAQQVMERTGPVIEAMRRLATEARTAESRSRPEMTDDIDGAFKDLKSLLQALLPHYSPAKRIIPDGIIVSVQGTPRPIALAPTAVERIIVNLCVNSAQWRASEVRVSAHFDRSHNEVQLVVRDNGRGVPAAGRDRVFDRFYSTRRGGSGLGLYVVRSIAARAGGDVHLQSVDHTESAEHHGTVVTVILPTGRVAGVNERLTPVDDGDQRPGRSSSTRIES